MTIFKLLFKGWIGIVGRTLPGVSGVKEGGGLRGGNFWIIGVVLVEIWEGRSLDLFNKLVTERFFTAAVFVEKEEEMLWTGVKLLDPVGKETGEEAI